MLTAIPLALLLLAAAPRDELVGSSAAAAVSPLLGEEVLAVGYLDLTRGDVPALARIVLGKQAEGDDLKAAIGSVTGWTDALKKAGARQLFVLLDLADIPGMPVVAIPLTEQADEPSLTEILTDPRSQQPIRWSACETIRGSLVAGSAEALARLRRTRPVPRPQLAEALAAGEGPIEVALIPNTTPRKALEEAMANLPPQFGGGPITTLTRGVHWAAVGLVLEPRPTLRLVFQAEGQKAAESLANVVERSLELLVEHSQKDEELAPLEPAIRRLKPLVQGERVLLEADLQDAAALVAIPIHHVHATSLRTRCVNNMKQLGLAMHNYHSTHDSFPPAYNVSKEGKALLSWRVHILPFLEEKSLYDEFHLNEPWNSPHNLKLVSRMPAVYACPSANRSLAKEGKTTYLTPRGPDTIFPGGDGIKISQITDGTSNTILIVDAGDNAAVTWTQPQDWEVVPDLKLPSLFGHHKGGTSFGFADGSVRFLKESVRPDLIKAMISRNGGEPLQE